jgi:hypothetical protein
MPTSLASLRKVDCGRVFGEVSIIVSCEMDTLTADCGTSPLDLLQTLGGHGTEVSYAVDYLITDEL